MELRRRALELLLLNDPAKKAAATRALFDSRAALALDTGAAIEAPPSLPGRSPLPRLMPHTALARRSPFTRDGRAALLHPVAHIEFNAINLALDACWRFAEMPPDDYRDWLGVAAEEALHFPLLREHPCKQVSIETAQSHLDCSVLAQLDKNRSWSAASTSPAWRSKHPRSLPRASAARCRSLPRSA